MRAAYMILPFIRAFITDRQIHHTISPAITQIKNVSIFDSFNTLDPHIQQFMLTL